MHTSLLARKIGGTVSVASSSERHPEFVILKLVNPEACFPLKFLDRILRVDLLRLGRCVYAKRGLTDNLLADSHFEKTTAQDNLHAIFGQRGCFTVILKADQLPSAFEHLVVLRFVRALNVSAGGFDDFIG